MYKCDHRSLGAQNKTLYKISMISIKYNTIKSYYATSAIREKKGWKRMTFYRSSHQRCSMQKDVRRNFTKFTEKNLYQSLTFNKVAGLRPATLLKKRLWHRCFPVNFAKFLGIPFFTEHVRTIASSFIRRKV